MFWPYSPFSVALQKQSPDGTPAYLVFPHQTIHASWCELALYLGEEFRQDWIDTTDVDMHAEFEACGDKDQFYHQSQRYLYLLTRYFLEGWKRAGYGFFFEILAPDAGQTVLDYGCGIGADGLWFLDQRIRVNFADFDNPCSRYLRWRLTHRTDTGCAQFYDIEHDTIPHHNIIWCMDVLEHLPSSEHVPFVQYLGTLGRVVILNMVDDKSADGTVHHPVDVDGLTTLLETLGAVSWKDMYHKPDGSKVRFLAYCLEEEA